MSDLKENQIESTNPPSIFRQLHSLASKISSETKRLQSNIITVGEHPHLYDGAANELLEEVSKLKKEILELNPEPSIQEFSSFIESARQQLKQHQRHADQIQLYIERYGYKAPARLATDADAAGAAAAPSPAPEDDAPYPDLLCELLSPELSASSRHGPRRPTNAVIMHPPQSNGAAGTRYKGSSHPPSPAEVFSAPHAAAVSPPPPPAACSPVFKIPIVKIRKPTDCDSLTSASFAELHDDVTAGLHDDVTVPDTPEPFKGQQPTFKPSTSSTRPSISSTRGAVRKSVSSSSIVQHRNDRLLKKSRTPPTAASPAAGGGGNSDSSSGYRCFATPNTKRTVEDWLQSVRSKHTPVVCSPSPLQFHLPKRKINNPILQNIPKHLTPLRTPVKLQVSSASPDLSSHKPIQRTLATKDLSLQKPHPSKPFGSDQQMETLGPRSVTSERGCQFSIKKERPVSSQAAKAEEDGLSDSSSLEEPVMSETTMNVLAEMARARAAETLKNSTACPPPPSAGIPPQPVPRPTEAVMNNTSYPPPLSSVAVPRPVPHYGNVPSHTQARDATDQPIDYSFKVPGPATQTSLSTSDKRHVPTARTTLAEMPQDLSTKSASNGTSQATFSNFASNKSAHCFDYSEDELSGVRIKQEFDTPEEPDYSKRFELNYAEKDIDTPEEPVLFSDQVNHVADFDTPEEPVLFSDFNKQYLNDKKVQAMDSPDEPDTPEEPTLSIHGQRSYMGSLFRTATEQQSKHIHFSENTLSDTSLPQKASIDLKTQSNGHNSMSHRKPSLPPSRVQQLLEDDDSVDKSPELSNASKRMMLDRRHNYAADSSHAAKGKHDSTREKENLPPSFSAYHQKSGSTQMGKSSSHATDHNKRASGRPRPTFEEDYPGDELDMSSLRIGAGNESLWNNSSLLHDHSGRRVVPDHSFSQAMLQYSHVKASPMPTPATSRGHRHPPSQL